MFGWTWWYEVPLCHEFDGTDETTLDFARIFKLKHQQIVDMNDDLNGPSWNRPVWGAGPIELPISLSGRVSYLGTTPHERAEYFWFYPTMKLKLWFFQKTIMNFVFPKWEAG